MKKEPSWREREDEEERMRDLFREEDGAENDVERE